MGKGLSFSFCFKMTAFYFLMVTEEVNCFQLYKKYG